MAENEKKDNKKALYLIATIIIALIILISTGMVNVTVLDPQSISNITLQINLT